VRDLPEGFDPGNLIEALADGWGFDDSSLEYAPVGFGSYHWIAQGLSKPLTSLAFASTTLPVTKAGGIVVVTNDLLKLGTPNAETVVRTLMVNGLARYLDTQFLDPAVAAVAGVNPASITHGLTPLTPSGTTPAAAATDFLTLLGTLTASYTPQALTLIASPANLAAIAIGLELPLFPTTGAFGVQVLASAGAGTTVVLLDPTAVLIADEHQVDVSVARQATVQMSDTPASPPTGVVSLWQQNLAGLRVERYISWQRASDAAVAVLTGAAYGTTP